MRTYGPHRTGTDRFKAQILSLALALALASDAAGPNPRLLSEPRSEALPRLQQEFYFCFRLLSEVSTLGGVDY